MCTEYRGIIHTSKSSYSPRNFPVILPIVVGLIFNPLDSHPVFLAPSFTLLYSTLRKVPNEENDLPLPPPLSLTVFKHVYI